MTKLRSLEVYSMIDAADSNTLLVWSKNVLTAENLEEIFENN